VQKSSSGFRSARSINRNVDYDCDIRRYSCSKSDQLAVARRTWIKIKNPPAAAIRNGLRSRRSAEAHHFLLVLASLQRWLSLVVNGGCCVALLQKLFAGPDSVKPFVNLYSIRNKETPTPP
jgi:hypothetical protein